MSKLFLFLGLFTASAGGLLWSEMSGQGSFCHLGGCCAKCADCATDCACCDGAPCVCEACECACCLNNQSASATPAKAASCCKLRATAPAAD